MPPQVICRLLRPQRLRLRHPFGNDRAPSAKRSDPISLAELAEEVICDLAAVGDKKGVRLTQKPGDAQITGSDTLLYRAIYNLIENAIKYNRQGGEVSVEIEEKNELRR